MDTALKRSSVIGAFAPIGGPLPPPDGTIGNTDRVHLSLSYASDLFAGVQISGSLAVTDGADTSASSGLITTTGTVAKTEGADTLAASGKITITGSISQTEGGDTSAASGGVQIAGTASVTEGSDTLAGVGAVGQVVIGTIASTEGADTSAASGVVIATGTVSATGSADTSAATGKGTITGSMAAIGSTDTMAASGYLPAQGTMSVTETGDDMSATGSNGAAADESQIYPGGGKRAGGVDEDLIEKVLRHHESLDELRKRRKELPVDEDEAEEIEASQRPEDKPDGQRGKKSRSRNKPFTLDLPFDEVFGPKAEAEKVAKATESSAAAMLVEKRRLEEDFFAGFSEQEIIQLIALSID